ncbi:MAG: UDP-N-acetylmuramoyl-L-alanine--D-glutamate ligase [Patescibacteria group bacterium]
MDARQYFEGKKITVLGLGLLGRGVGDAHYLASMGAELIITDLKSKEELTESLEKLAGFPNITYTLGEHRIEDFRGRDFILKAAGVPDPSVYLDAARAAGTPIKMSASWFAELAGIPVIGITGTRGKSTTTHMLHGILQAAGVPTLLGGNVRGVSTLSLLTEATPEHVALFELDSWQLQGFGESKMSPHTAVFTTFFPDHLNYYHDDLDAYLSDKANIFLFQGPEDTFVLGRQCMELIEEKYQGCIKGQLALVGNEDMPSGWKLRIPGAHARYDAALALAAARSMGINDEVSKAALEAFAGVPGRLEYVREVDGVAVYNDTTATTPEATLAALDALPAGNVVLIMGGADKGLDMDALLERIPAATKAVMLLEGTGTERIRASLPGASVHGTLAAAVEAAFAIAEPGDTVLFSPAFASFGMFKNEYDRGDQFMALIKAYGA